MKPSVEPMMNKIQLDMKGKKIDLQKLNKLFCAEGLYKSEFDLDSNPSCNFVMVDFVITGKARIFSSGSITTNLKLPKNSLAELFYYMQETTIKECLKE